MLLPYDNSHNGTVTSGNCFADITPVLLLSMLAREVMQSLPSVCPYIHPFPLYLSNQLTFGTHAKI